MEPQTNKLTKIGKIVNTHGIKGEIKIKSGSHFSNNDFVFTKQIVVNDVVYQTLNYRFHNGFHMITLKNFTNINEVLFLKGQDVYIDEKFLTHTNFDNLIGKSVINQENKKVIGIVVNILETKKYKIMELSNHKMVPYINHFVVMEKEDKVVIKNYGEI